METIEHSVASISMRDGNIVYFELKENAVIELAQAKEINEITILLTSGQRYEIGRAHV